jgi:CelD/BcsL family acetyltransferase involved in cellulose biosynthesis
MVMHKARKGSPICALTEIGAKVVDEGELAPQVTIDTKAPFTAFLQGISSKTRKNIRNYENRLARLGTVEHRVLTGAEAAEAIVASYDARRDWLDAKGMSSSAFRDQYFAHIVRGLARGERVGLDLIVFALSLDRRVIALQWGFIHANRYYAYLSSRDPAFEAYSVGRIHLQHVLKECHARNIGDIDLMVPAVPYKTTWSDAADVMVDLVWPWTLRGHLVIDLFARRLRPLLKTVARQMPESVRRIVYARLNAKRSAMTHTQPLDASA